jgi:hypothetical protein
VSATVAIFETTGRQNTRYLLSMWRCFGFTVKAQRLSLGGQIERGQIENFGGGTVFFVVDKES